MRRLVAVMGSRVSPWRGLALVLSVMPLALALASAQAQAQQASPAEVTPAETQAPPEKALKHYNRGHEHYKNGRYRDAVLELEIAVNLDPTSPNLAYNVARIYELLGEIDHAIAFYRRYIELLPAGEVQERERTETTLQRLTGARAVIDSAPKPKSQIRVRGVADAAFWTVFGCSALSLAGAGTTGVLALVTERQSDAFTLGEDGSAKRRQTLSERADRYALASDGMLAAGVSLGVTALLLYALRERTLSAPAQAERSFSLAVEAAHGGAFVALGGAL